MLSGKDHPFMVVPPFRESNFWYGIPLQCVIICSMKVLHVMLWNDRCLVGLTFYLHKPVYANEQAPQNWPKQDDTTEALQQDGMLVPVGLFLSMFGFQCITFKGSKKGVGQQSYSLAAFPSTANSAECMSSIPAYLKGINFKAHWCIAVIITVQSE